jgi:hypothetical protein
VAASRYQIGHDLSMITKTSLYLAKYIAVELSIWSDYGPLVAGYLRCVDQKESRRETLLQWNGSTAIFRSAQIDDREH